MNKGAFIIIGGLLALSLWSDLAYGQGRAALYLRRSVGSGQADSITTEFTARVGDTVSLDLYMDPAGDAVTGVQIRISFDSNAFEPVLQTQQGGGAGALQGGYGPPGQ